MEDFPQTMKAFETLVPRFFMGAGVLYDRASQALHENSKTASRKGILSSIWFVLVSYYIFSEPNPETVAYLKKGLSREYELYNYIKEVFYEKVNFLKSNGLWDPWKPIWQVILTCHKCAFCNKGLSSSSNTPYLPNTVSIQPYPLYQIQAGYIFYWPFCNKAYSKTMNRRCVNQ